MISILRAITWEFWRENRWWIIVSVSAILGLGSLVFYQIDTPYQQPNFVQDDIVQITVFFVEMMVFSICLCRSQYNKKKGRLGFPEHLFIKPVRIRSVALIRLGLAIVTVVSLHILIVGVFYLATYTYATWSIVLPCLYLAASVVFLNAMAWSLPGAPALQIFFSTAGLYVLCLIYFYDQHSNDSSHTLGLLIFIVLGSILALAGAALDRRSQHLKLTALWNRIVLAFTACLPWKNCHNVSPQRALFWFHWIKKGWIMPAISVTLMILGMILSWAVPWKRPAEFITIYFTLAFLLHLVGFPLLVSLITCSQESQNQGLPTYTSSLPVTNRDMLLAYLKASLASLVMSWVVFVIGICLLQLLLIMAGKGQYSKEFFSNLGNMTQGFSSLKMTSYNLFQTQIAYFLVVWGSLGLISSMLLTGRRSVGVITLTLLFTWPIIPALAEALDAPKSIIAALFILTAGLFIVGILGGTLAAFTYGTLEKRIHPYLTTSAVIFYIAIILFYANVIWYRPEDIVGVLAYLALMILPVAPFATAPLAMAWNRHR